MRGRKWLLLVPIAIALVVGIVVIESGAKTKSTVELIQDLKSPHEQDRIIAVRSLQVRSEDAAKVVPALMEALKDKQSDIRISAAIKLGLFGDLAKEAVPALQTAQADRDARVRNAATKSLAQIDPNLTSNPASDKRD
jgi:HEAT repeat protein